MATGPWGASGRPCSSIAGSRCIPVLPENRFPPGAARARALPRKERREQVPLRDLLVSTHPLPALPSAAALSPAGH